MTGVLLALDTATSAVTAAVHDGTRVLAKESIPEARRHAETLAPTIDLVMKRAGLAPSDLSGVAVGVGPGPFTGLRVGLVTATTLGFVLDIPVYGVCSLDAIAYEVAAAGSCEEFLVATDARRKEVYWARYTAVAGGVHRHGEPAVATADSLDRDMRDLPVAGRGPLLYPQSFPQVIEVADVDAGLLGALVVARRRDGGELLQPRPMYLRQPDAQPSAARKAVHTKSVPS